DAFSAPQIEHALDLLLNLYRDIRYSVNPRFELEAAASKLCWLTQWIPLSELRDAVDAARKALGGQRQEPPGQTGSAHTPYSKPDFAGGGSLTEHFNRYMASREAGARGSPAPEPEVPAAPPDRSGPGAAQIEQIEAPPAFEAAARVERVIRLFSGTLITDAKT
ncbi:MAG: hypothetical protein LBD13_03685, partial [Spirochaetaceae bacterium]|nr:hypothetical protein [Spirochaetaceae bacterium]